MGYNTQDIEVIGVVLDLSARHSLNGKTNLFNVKKSLVDFFKTNLEDDDIMYLYRPDVVTPVNRVGAQVGVVSNYHTDGWKFDLTLALRQTLFIIAAEPYDQKILLLITDRLQDSNCLKRLSILNKKDDLGCRLVVIDIGLNVPDTEFADVVHVVDAQDLIGTIKDIIYGQNKNSCSDCSS